MKHGQRELDLFAPVGVKSREVLHGHVFVGHFVIQSLGCVGRDRAAVIRRSGIGHAFGQTGMSDG